MSIKIKSANDLADLITYDQWGWLQHDRLETMEEAAEMLPFYYQQGYRGAYVKAGNGFFDIMVLYKGDL